MQFRITAGHVGFITKRYDTDEALAALREDSKSDPFSFVRHSVKLHRDIDSAWTTPLRNNSVYTVRGLVVEDSEEELFPKAGRSLVQIRQKTLELTCALKPSLPSEIIEIIRNKMSDVVAASELTTFPDLLELTMTRFEIHALCPIDDASQCRISNAVKTYEPNLEVHIHDWRLATSASKSEFFSLMKHITAEKPRPVPRPLFFLSSPEDSLSRPVAITVARREGPLVSVMRVEVPTAVDMWTRGLPMPKLDLDGKLPTIVSDPSAKFFKEPPLYFSSDGFAPSVIFLTAQPSLDGLKSFKEYMINCQRDVIADMELGEDAEIDYRYTFVGWERESDGGEIDMLEIAAEHILNPFNKSGKGSVIFADKQSMSDKTVILAR